MELSYTPALKQNLNFGPHEQKMDGFNIMVRITRKTTNSVLLGIIAFLLIMPVFNTAMFGISSSGQESMPKMSPSLQRAISETPAGDMIPITIHFDATYNHYLIEETLSKANIQDIQIRTIFEIVPFASLYASANAISQLTELVGVLSINYDKKVVIPQLEVASVPPVAEVDAGYVHPDKQIGVDNLWDEGYDGTGITVAVIDSGADGTHPDLAGKISGFYDLVNDRSDMDASDGIDAYDDNGHGTACTWLITGSGEGTDYAYTGLAIGAKVLAIKALDSTGAADDSVIAEGIQYAVGAGVDIISLSVGGDWIDDNPLYSDLSANAAQAAVEAGVVVVVAGGNSGPATTSITSPGVVQEAITVGASIGNTDVVSFSSRGPVVRTNSDPIGSVAKPDVLAPGYNILSGIIDNADPFEYPPYNTTQFSADYTLWSGTSASCPQVAAVAALLLDKHPALTPLELKALLMDGATDLDIDPLEQGYGLVNATRTSELITQTSGVITLVAPMRYPTLPGTSQVLIVGDTRDPTNATVISTVNRGAVVIEVTGNASQFVTTDAQVQIQVGYNYFSIGLNVPSNLPLSALGRYTGSVNLVASSVTIASIDLDLLITSYGGRMLVDMAHHSATDQDDVSYYRYFTEYLREQGMVITDYPENWNDEFVTLPPFDSGALSKTEVLLIMDTEQTYSQTEIDLIHNFVEDGGTLLILSEGFDTTANTAAFAIESYNQILEPYGIQCENNWIGDNGAVFGVDNGGAVDSNPLTDGVENLYVLNGGTLSVNASVIGTQGLFWADAAKTHAIVAIASPGSGKVIAISDGSILYDTSIYDAILREADNLKLLENIAESVIPYAPRIFDVEFVTDGVGNEANLTAYVFDENLESVVISIIGPNGELVEGTTAEALGYIWRTEFTLETTGCYDITVTATNSEGYTRTFTETILVPVPALEDDFLMAVIYGLLAVVGAALCYVGILKFGVGKKVRRATEKEWTPQWEDTGAPPSIE